MDMNTKVIPLHLHPLGFVEAFIHFGASIDELLENTEINNNMIDSDHAYISYAQQSRLIKNGIKACKKPGLGLLVGGYIDWCFHGTLGSVVFNSPCLRDACNAFFHYAPIPQPYYSKYRHEKSFYLDANDIIVEPILSFGPTAGDAELIEFELEFKLAVTLRICDLCGNKSVADTSVHVCLEYEEPAHVYRYRDLPCSSIKFSCDRSVISAGLDFVTKPWRLFRKNAFYRTLKQCDKELQQAPIELSLANQVRWHISTIYFVESVNLEKIAERLCLSPRVLTRRLSNEGLSFRSVYHDVRMELTKNHLQYSNLNLQQIVSLMKFSSESSLRRAIKNWNGCAITQMKLDNADNSQFNDFSKSSPV